MKGLRCSVMCSGRGFVAQIGLRSGFPLPRKDLLYSLSIGYAKRREAIEDRSADLDLSNRFCRKVWRHIKKLEFCSPPDTFGRQVSENFLLCGRNFG
jgi:hypothetical protein